MKNYFGKSLCLIGFDSTSLLGRSTAVMDILNWNLKNRSSYIRIKQGFFRFQVKIVCFNKLNLVIISIKDLKILSQY